MADIDQLSRTIGALEATIDNLTDTWARQEVAATDGRRALHGKLDEVREEVAALRGELKGLVKTVGEDLQPKVSDYWTLRQKAAGAVLVLGMLSMLVIGAIGFFFREFSGWVVRHLQWG